MEGRSVGNLISKRKLYITAAIRAQHPSTSEGVPDEVVECGQALWLSVDLAEMIFTFYACRTADEAGRSDIGAIGFVRHLPSNCGDLYTLTLLTLTSPL